MRRLLHILLATLLLSACRQEPPRTILPDDVELQAGDLVFRRGSGMTSRVVIAADAGGHYSHVGIVVDSAGQKMIVHAVPGEPDYKGDPDRVKMDTPSRFFSSINAQRGEVCRFKGDAETARRAAQVAVEIYRRHTLFDHDYNDSDTVRMYCCQLVEHAYQRAGATISEGRRSSLSFPGVGKYHCMLPSDLWKSSRLRSVKAF